MNMIYWNLPESEKSETRLAYEKLWRELKVLRRQHVVEENLVRAQFMKLQSECQHRHVKYIPDASGNNDSSTDCLECGKEL